MLHSSPGCVLIYRAASFYIAKGYFMKKRLVLLLLFCALGSAPGCTHTSVSFLKYEKCSPRRSTSQVQVFYSRKAIPNDYKVVAKYRVATNSRRYPQVLRKVSKMAAEHGSDAIVVDQGFGATATVWSWVFFFIPVTEHVKHLYVSGIRYLSVKGGIR